MNQRAIAALLDKGIDTSTPLAHYALVDAAATAGVTDSDEIYSRLSRPDVVKYTLFSGENAWAAERSAPYLVPLQDQPEIEQWLYEKGWGKSWAVFLSVDAQVDDQASNHPIQLIDHFRRFFEVQAENGRNLFFRFFDPVILRDFIPMLDEPESALFFGPVRRFVFEDEQQKPLLFDQPGDTPPTGLSPSELVLGKRYLFSNAWNRRLMQAHQQQYEAMGVKTTADPEQSSLTIQEKDGTRATLQKSTQGVTVTTGEGRLFQYELSACKNPEAIVDPADHRIEMDVQDRENVATKSKQSLLHAIRMENNCKTWVFDYDERNHLEQIDYPDHTSARFEHDAYGNLHTHTDRNGSEIRFDRDDQERLMSMVDVNGHNTTFGYQDRNAPARITFGDGNTFGFDYTDEGHLKTFLANDQRVADYSVDPEGGSWTAHYSDGTEARFVVEEGLIVRAENPAGTLKLAYDDQGRLASETFKKQTVSYQRNDSGKLTGITGPLGQTVAFAHDGEQRVSKAIDWNGQTIEISYAANGAMEELSYPNGVRLQQHTAASGLPEEMVLRHPNSDSSIFRRRIERDLLDRVISIRDVYKSIDYRYDNEGRLLGAKSNLERFSEQFEIDAKANRLADGRRRYKVNPADRISSKGFNYDTVGNQTSGIGPRGETRLEWQAANRLAAASVNQTQAQYAYDAFGRRVEKIVNGRRTRTIWAGAQPLQEIVSDADGDRTIDYLFFPGTPVVLAIRDDGQIRYASFGHRYETLCLTDTNAEVVWQADYDAFGNARIESGEEIFQPFRLAGHYLDEETGLHYSAARYYDPNLGRYLSMDPLFLEGGGDNFYAYCNGDPINSIDPTGEFIFCAILIGAAMGAAIGAGMEYYRQKQSGDELDGYKVAKAALIGGAIGAIGGGVGAAVEGAVAADAAGTVLAKSALATMATAGFLSGAASSVAEQCAESALTDKAVPPLEIAKQATTDGMIGAAIGLVSFGIGGSLARRAKRTAMTAADEVPVAKIAQLNKAAKQKSNPGSSASRGKGRSKADHSKTSTTGEPVNAVTGEVVLTQTDFSLPGRIALTWTRHYGSQVDYSGLLGKGWQTPADARLALEDDMVVFYDGTPGGAVFEKLPVDEALMEMNNGAVLSATADGYRVRLKSGLAYHFKADAVVDSYLVTQISDRDGNEIRFVRHEGTLTAIEENSDRRIDIECKRGRIVKMSCSGRPLVSYSYQMGELTSAVDAMQQPRRYAYDNTRMVRHTDRNHLSFQYEYDTKGRCIHSFGDNGLYDYQFEYLPYQRCTRVTNSLGHVWHYHYDEDKLPVKVVDGNGAATVYEYDDVGRMIAITDALERITRYEYDDAGNILEITRRDENRVAMVYDNQHRPIQILDPNDNIWGQQYDQDGHLIARVSPMGHTTTYAYGPSGDLSLITDPEGRTTGFAWGQDRQLKSVTHPSGEQIHYQRDLLGNITAVIDAAGSATRYSYDERSRLCAAVSPTGLRQTFEWDPEDNLLLHINAAGHQTRFEYTGLNEISRRINPDGTSVHYDYDSEEQLTAVTNEKGQTHNFAYDAAGNVIGQTDYWNHTRRYTYDPAGQLLQSVDPMARTVAYGYDNLGRIIQKLFESEEREIFSWDRAGNLIAFESPEIRIERTFDPDGRLSAETSPKFSVQYEYDSSGQRTQRTTSSGNRISYTYDDNGMVSTLGINNQKPMSFHRNRLGQITTDQLSEKLARTYGYDEEGRLVHQCINSDIHQIERRFDYDLSGNLIAKHDSTEGTWQFDYDPMGRILESIDPWDQVKQHIYDPAGDLLSQLPDSQDGLRTATHESRTYRFDAAGNLAQRKQNSQTTQFAWDEQNRLCTVHTPDDTTIRMAYDALGRRCQKSVNGQRSFFAWDGDALLAEQFEDEQAREYVYYPGTFEPLALIDHNSQIYYYHNDPNGLPQELTKPNGDIVWLATYDAQGRIAELHTDKITQPLRMQGQYFDQEIDLCYNRHRYYDSQICSFISQDPLGLAAGENVYAYAPNVWGWVDPLGLECKTAPKKIPGIKVLRKDIDPFDDDKYGHWWIEIDDNESYGWWPKEPVGLKGTLFGVEGGLNGQTHFGGTRTLDPHHGDTSAGVNVFHVFGPQSKDAAVESIRDYANFYNGKWSWPAGQNCHSFQKKMLKDLGLSIK